MKNVFLVRTFKDEYAIQVWLNKLPSGSGVAALSENNNANIDSYTVIVWIPEKFYRELPSNWEDL